MAVSTHGILDREGQLREHGRVSNWAVTFSGIGHVGAVVGAVEIAPVPAVREHDDELQRRTGLAIGRHHSSRRARPAGPPGELGDHTQVTGKWLDRRCFDAEARTVVGHGLNGLDLFACIEQRWRPVRRGVALIVAGRLSNDERVVGRLRVRRVVAEN